MLRVTDRAKNGFKYQTRRLLPGDTFEPRPKDRRLVNILLKQKVVEPADDDAVTSASAIEPAPDDPALLIALRAAYHATYGKRPFNGWGVEALRDKIEAAKAAK
jgi:hypothetical protein